MKKIYTLKKLAPIIVDTHQHLGKCRIFDYDQDEDYIINNMDSKGIDASIVQPFPGAFPQPPEEEHNRIAKLAEKHHGRIFGMCSVNPLAVSDEEWLEEVERCIKNLGFVGIKLHTLGHSLIPSSPAGMRTFEIANKYNVPVMVHTGHSVMASPSLIIPAARKWPNLPIILAHAGFVSESSNAINVASMFKNVFLEWSWGMADDIVMGINQLGIERNLFGSDIPNNTLTELVKADEAGLDREQLELYLGKNAIKIFNLKINL